MKFASLENLYEYGITITRLVVHAGLNFNDRITRFFLVHSLAYTAIDKALHSKKSQATTN